MPEGVTAPLSGAQIARESSPSIRNGAATSSSTPTLSLSSFPPYEVEDELSRTGTPPPIKVTRAKKKTKASGTGKKKRTATIEAPSATSNS